MLLLSNCNTYKACVHGRKMLKDLYEIKIDVKFRVVEAIDQ